MRLFFYKIAFGVSSIVCDLLKLNHFGKMNMELNAENLNLFIQKDCLNCFTI